jgi:cytochrome c biogenesis protein
MESSSTTVSNRRHATSLAWPTTNLDRGLARARRLVGSVRFGLVLLGLLLALCVLGMVVMQQNMAGFADYYAGLTPATRYVYGKLGLFDVYGSWYFAALLALTGVNIVMSSIERFPAAWRFVRRPKLNVSRHYVRTQAVHHSVDVDIVPADAVSRVAALWRANGLTPRVTERGGRTTIFAQCNAWNRLGAYAVHVALLVVFAGGFVTSRLAVSGVVTVEPGSSADTFVAFDQDLGKQTAHELRLPFRIDCTDIEQQLVDPAGGLEPSNTLDWLSRVRIADGADAHDALIHLNEPLDYRGYRFFQSSFEPEGSARTITVRLDSAATGDSREITVGRNEGVEVAGVGRLDFVGFYPDFRLAGGRPATRSGEYNNPVAELRLTTPDGASQSIYALGPELEAALASSSHLRSGPFRLADGSSVSLERFEKVARSHMLRVQYDPGKYVVYAGFVMLVFSLALTFAFAHERYWALVEPSAAGATISVGASTNRNPAALRYRFAAFVAGLDTTGSKS